MLVYDFYVLKSITYHGVIVITTYGGIKLMGSRRMREKEWLCARGLTNETIAQAGLTFEDGKIRVPWRIDGKEVGYQLRWINEKRVQFNPGFEGKTIYLPKGNLPQGYSVYVTEGPWDALILSQLGYPAVGIPSASNYHGVRSLPFKNVYLALDNDEAGQLCEESIAALGSPHKLFKVIYKGKDPNECVLKNEGVFPNEIVPYIVGGIKHIREVHLNGNLTNSSIITFTNGLPSWNNGDLVVLYGREKSGKSSWILKQLAESKVPALLEEYEMPPERVKDWFQKLGGTDDHALYITTQFKEFSLHNITGRIYSAVRQLGVKLVVIDHVHFLASGKENIVNMLAHVTQKLKLMALELGICVVILAHETGGEIRDCRMIGGNADSILHLRRIQNGVLIDGKFRYHPAGTFTFPLAFGGGEQTNELPS